MFLFSIREQGGHMSTPALEIIADEILTFIEQREAEQIAYGIYAVSTTGADVLESYTPLNSTPLPQDQRDSLVREALQLLASKDQIIRLNSTSDPLHWQLRSRIGETVRLISLLKQRLVDNNAKRDRHRISSGKRLVGDVKFHVAVRRVPDRNLLASRVVSDTLPKNQDERYQQTADILLQVIERDLPKLQRLSGFQAGAFGSILKVIELDQQREHERGVVVTAGTGAGKTYAFLLPVLTKVIMERCLRQRVGVKAICIYPRVALSENQLADMIEILHYLNRELSRRNLLTLSVGIESGAATYDLRSLRNTDPAGQKDMWKRGWNYNKQIQAYTSPFAYCVGTAGTSCESGGQRLIALAAQPEVLRCPACDLEYPFILFSRDVMAQNPPDILIATTESLNRRLVSSEHQYLFGTDRFCAPSVVMLDEIHLQTSTSGAQVALLLRRLLARIRMGKRDRGERANLAFVGLSATIAEPRQFLSDLSGIEPVRIDHIAPKDEDMLAIGAERYIFVRAGTSEDTAVISTLIQTAMCIIHTMPQPAADSGLSRYRTFGFVQSLDIVGRWLYQMEDAEKVRRDQQRDFTRQLDKPVKDWFMGAVPLFYYRYPPYNRQLFPDLFGKGHSHSCGCEGRDAPDTACAFFQSGECWWALSRDGRALQTPMNIKRKSGSDRATPIEDTDDLIITTSALEVGYDDEALMCVIQYTAPSNIASFVQRKGRGGRKVGTRPIVVTVLSPYKSTDSFLFRNHHILTDPVFRKLPLNPQNRFLQRIHSFYALMDWAAYRASRDRVELDLSSIKREGYMFLRELTSQGTELMAFRDYVAALELRDPETQKEVLLERAHGMLMRVFADGLMKQAHREIVENKERFFNGPKALTQHLPSNLFSDINLPEVQVRYRGGNLSPSTENISFALNEMMPGNVTFRGGEGSVWVPPETNEDGVLDINEFFNIDERRSSLKISNLALRARKLVGLDDGYTHEVTLLRPTEIKPVAFSDGLAGADWAYEDQGTGGILHKLDNQSPLPQTMKQLSHASSAYAISAVEIAPDRNDPPEDFVFRSSAHELKCDPLAGAFDELVLYSGEIRNSNMLKVQRVVLGSQYTLKLHDAPGEEIRGVTSFTKDPDTLERCALGYEMRTEGISLRVPAEQTRNLSLPPELVSELRYNAVRHSLITYLTVECSENFFAAQGFADVILTLADQHIGQGGDLETLSQWIMNKGFLQQADVCIANFYRMSKRQTEGVQPLLAQPTYIKHFLDLYREARTPGSTLLDRYLYDTFKLTLTQGLKQAAQEVAGIEALNYIAAWTELYVDYKSPGTRIWLYEIGMGGIGVMRGTHEVLRNQPDKLWSSATQQLTRCPVAQEEALLRHVLGQDEQWLDQMSVLAQQILAARSSSERRRTLSKLAGEVRRAIGIPVRDSQTKALLRIFTAEYEDGNAAISNWKIYREINTRFLHSARQELGRWPSFAEARAMLYAKAVNAGADGEYPELMKLLQLYCAEYGLGSESKEVRDAFENAVERRLLITCINACPSCLADRSSEIESPGMIGMLLSRPLMSEWLRQRRAPLGIDLTADVDLSVLSEQLGVILQSGPRVGYLRLRGSDLTKLSEAISYLSDAGIETAAGLLYPMVTNIETIFPFDPAAAPMIELTIRPIT
jgi:hypothetical protein